MHLVQEKDHQNNVIYAVKLISHMTLDSSLFIIKEARLVIILQVWLNNEKGLFKEKLQQKAFYHQYHIDLEFCRRSKQDE